MSLEKESFDVPKTKMNCYTSVVPFWGAKKTSQCNARIPKTLVQATHSEGLFEGLIQLQDLHV